MKATLTIEPNGGYTHYYMGSVMTGNVTWQADQAPKSAELRLFWYAESNKGTMETETVQILTFDNPQPTDRRPYQIQLPKSPFSYTGKLFSIHWALELVLEPSEILHRQEIVISSTGHIIETLNANSL